MTYEFKGDNKALVSSITALLALDAKGALVPHGIGEMARQLLEASSVRLAEQQHGKPVALPQRKDDPNPENYGPFDSQLNEECMEVIGWNACLDEIAKLGPLYRHPVQGEPVAWINFPDEHNEIPFVTWRSPDEQKHHNALMGAFDTTRMCIIPLYTHADPGEVEQFPHGSPANKAVFMALESYTGATTFEQACIQLAEESRALRAQLAEANRLLTKIRDTEIHEGRLLWDSINNHLSASAEPSTPVEIDEPTDLATWKRRAIEAESKLRTYDPQAVELGEKSMQALLAEPKPSEVVLTKCKLCDQLQADLTERDERIDQLRSGYVFETGPYQVELSEDQWNAALGVFENYNMGDDKHFVFLEEQGRGVISEILIEIGVARAPDADEVVE